MKVFVRIGIMVLLAALVWLVFKKPEPQWKCSVVSGTDPVVRQVCTYQEHNGSFVCLVKVGPDSLSVLATSKNAGSNALLQTTAEVRGGYVASLVGTAFDAHGNEVPISDLPDVFQSDCAEAAQLLPASVRFRFEGAYGIQ